jgi:flavin reductase (DIM6/NTAB) family NADH-FMN oxidoreductase RutF
VGSLSIVTTQQAEVSGAMLAYWVSQATFKVAVAKERAIELLLEKISFVAIAKVIIY